MAAACDGIAERERPRGRRAGHGGCDAGVAVSQGREPGDDDPEARSSTRTWIEALILLPENLFYNTTAAGIIVVLRREKAADRKGRVILINASTQFIKGRPKNELTDEGIRKVADAFRGGVNVEKLAKVVTLDEIRRKDFNLSPSAYVQTGSPAEHREIQPILDELASLDEKARVLDGELATIFTRLGFKWGNPK